MKKIKDILGSGGFSLLGSVKKKSKDSSPKEVLGSGGFSLLRKPKK